MYYGYGPRLRRFHIFGGGAIIMRVYLHSAFLEINSSDASIPNILVHY